MGKPYSEDLRERIVRYILQGHSARAAGRVFGVSASTAVRLAAAHRRDGDMRPKRQGRQPGTTGKLAPVMSFLREVVQSDPDITLAELAGALEDAENVWAHVSSIHGALVRFGLS